MRTQLLDDAEGIAWLLDVYPFVQDGKPIAAAIVSDRWISCYEINHYKCKSRVWCVEGHMLRIGEKNKCPTGCDR